MGLESRRFRGKTGRLEEDRVGAGAPQCPHAPPAWRYRGTPVPKAALGYRSGRRFDICLIGHNTQETHVGVRERGVNVLSGL